MFLSAVFVYNFAWAFFSLSWPVIRVGSIGGGSFMKILIGKEGRREMKFSSIHRAASYDWLVKLTCIKNAI